MDDVVMSGSLWMAVPIAAFAGLLSFFSPCVIPLLPGYLSYASGVAVSDVLEGKVGRARVVAGTVLFVLGFSVLFISYGTFFGAVGSQLQIHARGISALVGVVLVALGLRVAGALRWGRLQGGNRLAGPRGVGLAVAPVLGVVLGLGWTPCISPALIAVNSLALSADRPNAARGALLGLAYCAGLGGPFVLMALAFERLSPWLAIIKRRPRALSVVVGGLLVLTGVLLVAGQWDRLIINLRDLAV